MMVGTDEKAPGSRPTALTSSYLVTAQNPGPSGSGCQWTGSRARSHWNWSWGCPWAKAPGASRSIVGAGAAEVMDFVLPHEDRARSLRRVEVGLGQPGADVVVQLLRAAQVDHVEVPSPVVHDPSRDPGVLDPARQGERQRHPPPHGPQLGERAGPFEEDPHRDGLDVDGPHGAEVAHDLLEDRPLVGWSRGEVLIEGHGRGALVGLLDPSELAPASRTLPRWHVDILP